MEVQGGRPSIWPSWLTNAFAIAVFATGCIAAGLVLQANRGVTVGAGLAAANIASTEVSEMVGTNAYLQTQRPQAHTPMTALMETFGIPIGNPLGLSQGSHRSPSVQTSPPVHARPPVLAPTPSPPTPVATKPVKPQRIVLGWVPSGASATEIESLIQANPGVNVISPTWFQLASGSGAINAFVQPQVVTYAHQQHVQVWAMIDNQYSATLAHALLANPNAAANFVTTLATDAIRNHLDGINLDFENMHTSDQAAYTALVGDLHQQLAPHHIKVSVDITPDIVYLRDTDVYFHAGLAANADAVMVMAYDEHWSNDVIPGPVADMPWVTTAVDDLLNTGVPATKVVLGIPFYTYFWHVTTSGSVAATAYATTQVAGILAAHQAVRAWQPDLQLGFAKYSKPDGYEEVWYETAQTLKDQVDLVRKLGLAGVAIWSLQLSDPHTWSLMMHALTKPIA